MPKPRSASKPADCGQKAADLSRDVEQTVTQVATAVIAHAEREVQAACCLLEALGVIPPEHKSRSQPVGVPEALMLKAAAIMRLHHWEEAELIDRLSNKLPSALNVLADLPAAVNAKATQRYPARELSQNIFNVWFDRMAWEPIGPTADVDVSGIDPEAMLDELAELIFAFRHLANDQVLSDQTETQAEELT